ncbi:transketolase family protein [Candidatus Epulonipiscium viviparus]|uniref:transketolase family protein n=1 Tax=Candidatus Epulonipiscium viviparus TaxID=420336 RepID=UPI00016BFB28|nr:transketolase family protein [Candidatus Epulopiscium viviparus]
MATPTREAYGKALAKLGHEKEFFVLDSDLAKATATIHFKNEHPQRFFDMGIAESDMMSTAAGMATCGKKVFASTFAVFAAGRAYEQIRNSIAYPNLPVVIGATHGGVMIGEDGASHQAIEDVSLMRTMPNMTVVVPADAASTTQFVEQAMDFPTPLYIRAGRGATPDIYNENIKLTIGKGNVLIDGTDLTIIAMGELVSEALQAAKQLDQRGISTAVIDMHTVKPIDRELVCKYAKKTGKIITAEDHSIIGGLGSAVAEILAETGDATLKRLGINDVFGKSGTRSDLQEYFNLTAKGIIELALK